MTQAQGQAFTNVKTIAKSSVTGIETMQYHPVKTETFPASGRIEKS
jgi:hypothetical protein